MNVGMVQRTDNKIIFDHNKKVLPSLIQISSLDEIDSAWEFFFYLEGNEIVQDRYRFDKISRVDDDVKQFFSWANDLKKDVVYIPISTVNYSPFPPRLLDFQIKPRIFRTSLFTPDNLNDPVRKDKKSLYSILLFNIYLQTKSNVEIGKETYGTMPKFVEHG